MIRKKIKYIKGFILFALFSIFAFSPLCFIGAHAYHMDSNGNLVSDNLIDNSINVFEMGAVSYNVGFTYQQNKVSNNARIRTINLISVDNTKTYSLSVPSPYLVIAQGYNNGLQVSSNGTQFNQALSNLSFTGVSQVSIIVRKADNSNFSNINDISNIDLMFNEGSLMDYEPYGAVYYSQENYDNAYYRNYGLLGYCSKITVEINSNPVITDQWNGIQELLNDKSYITMNNNVFSIRWANFLHEYTNDVTYRTSWKFYFDNTYPSVGLYDSFTSEVANGNYQLISSNVDLLSYGSIPSGESVDFSSYSTYNYGRFDWNCNTPNIGLAFGTLYFTNTNSNDYINGYNDGKRDGLNYADNNVNVNSASYLAGSSTGYSDGYSDGQDFANSHVDTDSASYQAGVSSQGGYNAGYSAGYAKGRTEQSYIIDTNTQGNDLIWTIASTPWESFKNIWNVNVLGINLANLVTGFITAIILLWIIKRFWK